MKIKIWFLMVGLLSAGLQARYYVVKNESQFTEELNKHEFAVVSFLGFIDDDISKDDLKKARKDMHVLQDTIKATSDTDPYNKTIATRSCIYCCR